MTRRALAPALALAAALALATPAAAGPVPAAAAGSAPGPAAGGVPLRVMSYNIHAGAGEDGVFDLARTAAAIGAEHPDVVGLQEVDVRWSARSGFTDEAADLARALGMRVFFAPIYDLPPLTAGAPDRRYGLAVLSRFPILRAVNHEITRLSTQVPDPVPAPAPGFPEVVLAVGGVPVHLYATHLDYRADPAVRRAQVADTLALLAAGPPGRQVLVGDFNAGPAAAELAPLWRRLTDTMAAAGAGGQGTYPALAPTARIDYVAVSPGIAVRAASAVATGPPGGPASDHRAVVADLTLREP